MTRLNLVPPSELADQHLFSEFREIKMVAPKLAATMQSLHRQGKPLYALLDRIPKEFCLGKGHVTFFYNKGLYLQQRYSDLRRELDVRKVDYNRNALVDSRFVFSCLPAEFQKDYTPTDAALALARARIAERIALKPDWYRWTK